MQTPIYHSYRKSGSVSSIYDPHRLQFKKMATSSVPPKNIATHSVLPAPKHFRVEQENNAKMNLYRFHLRQPEETVTLPMEVKEALVPEPSPSPAVVQPPAPAVPQAPTIVHNKEDASTIKYRLEKVKDELTGQYRFKLLKVGFDNETPSKEAVSTAVAIIDKETIAPPRVTTKTTQRFRLEKTSDGGVSKYALKDLSEECAVRRPDDLSDESVNIKDLYTPSSNAIQHVSLHRKVMLTGIEKNGGIFLLGDEAVGQNFTMRDVLHNSHFLNSTYVLENITIKIITDTFDKSTQCKLSLYYIEPDGHELIVLHTIDLGSLEEGSLARYYTRLINVSTPKQGCILVSVLEITPENGLLLPRKGKMMIEYNISATKKLGMQDKTIQWSNTEKTPMLNGR